MLILLKFNYIPYKIDKVFSIFIYHKMIVNKQE